jgi:Ca2+-binding EF-hand superfamily protein
LKWAFKLYDMDNNGVIDIKEMAAIIETLDCIEGVKPGKSYSITAKSMANTGMIDFKGVKILDCIEWVKPG